MSEMLLERHKKKSFLHRIVTGDEEWIHYDDPKRKKSYAKPGQQPDQRKSRISIWWDQNQWITLPKLIRLKRAIAEKRPEYATRREAIIFHHDNARPHVDIPANNYLENSGWGVLPNPP